MEPAHLWHLAVPLSCPILSFPITLAGDKSGPSSWGLTAEVWPGPSWPRLLSSLVHVTENTRSHCLVFWNGVTLSLRENTKPAALRGDQTASISGFEPPPGRKHVHFIVAVLVLTCHYQWPVWCLSLPGKDLVCMERSCILGLCCYGSFVQVATSSCIIKQLTSFFRSRMGGPPW